MTNKPRLPMDEFSKRQPNVVIADHPKAVTNDIKRHDYQSAKHHSKNHQDKHHQHQPRTVTAKKNTVLEFVHITKTGGTSIELAAAKSGIAWGMCKFLACPPLEKAVLHDKKEWACKLETAPWHCPPRHLERPMYKGSKTFAIVRNPYDRIISEYYFKHSFAKNTVDTPARLNSWISKQLESVSRKGVCWDGHCIPMHQYTHDSEGNQIVDHVLRLEHLGKELPALLSGYGLDEIQLDEKKHKSGREEGSVLNVTHLTERTICQINEWARLDFEYFHYDVFGKNDSCA